MWATLCGNKSVVDYTLHVLKICSDDRKIEHIFYWVFLYSVPFTVFVMIEVYVYT